jgi:3-hydroxybutyrate dehydrogenase
MDPSSAPPNPAPAPAPVPTSNPAAPAAPALTLAGTVALITGAGSGIGRALALAFAAQGASISVCDLDPASAAAVAAEITSTYAHTTGATALAVQMDVASETSVEAGVAATLAHFGNRLDTLVSNAGVQAVFPLESFPYDAFRRVVDVHLNGAFLLTRACVRHMYTSRGGRGGTLLYMGSIHSHTASALKSAYVAAKHGLLGLARAAALEGAPHGVRANVICPGFVRTPLVDRQIPQQAAELGISEDEVVKRIMLGQTVDKEFTTLDEVARTAVFLAGFGSNGLTGQSITVSHGWHMQ